MTSFDAVNTCCPSSCCEKEIGYFLISETSPSSSEKDRYVGIASVIAARCRCMASNAPNGACYSGCVSEPDLPDYQYHFCIIPGLRLGVMDVLC